MVGADWRQPRMSFAHSPEPCRVAGGYERVPAGTCPAPMTDGATRDAFVSSALRALCRVHPGYERVRAGRCAARFSQRHSRTIQTVPGSWRVRAGTSGYLPGTNDRQRNSCCLREFCSRSAVAGASRVQACTSGSLRGTVPSTVPMPRAAPPVPPVPPTRRMPPPCRARSAMGS